MELYDRFIASKAFAKENGNQTRSAVDVKAEFAAGVYQSERCSRAKQDDVKGFLVTYFNSHADSNPQDCSKYIHMSFFDLYQMEYVRTHCLTLGLKPVSYSQFMKIKKLSFPFFRRSRRNKASKGWDHIRCADCEYFIREIRKAMPHTEEKRDFEKGFKAHLEKQ